jgi:hypothetical protein
MTSAPHRDVPPLPPIEAPARVCVADPHPPAPHEFKLKPSDRGTVEPLSAVRHRVQFTASQVLRDKLELALDLMAHQNPGRDLAPLVEKGLDLLIAELMKKRFGQTSRPYQPRPSQPER